MPGYGCRSMTDPLRRVLVRRPSIPACSLWKDYGWRDEPDPTALLREHEAFCAILEGVGCDVVVATPMDADPDAIYAFDPGLVTEHGAILMRPGKAGRRAEPLAIARELEPAGVPVTAVLDEPAVAEGGDFIRLDETTLLAGRGYRTNDAGIETVAQTLPSVETLTFDLPHWHGDTEVMHLLSLLSPLDADLVVAYPPLLPVALAQLLAEREIQIVPVPDEEFESMGTNVLALAPRVALALDGNPVTRERLVAAGVEVLVYEGRELSLKGDGGPTCLTMPVWRAA
jgi:N-dimethylarginine dimethylaminohydrolase